MPSNRHFTFVLMLFVLTALSCGCGSKTDSANENDGTTSNESDSGDKGSIVSSTETAAADVETSEFRFFYDVTLTDLEPNQDVSVWVPLAKSDAYQQVQVVRIEVDAEFKQNTDAATGNRMLHFTGKANASGQVPIMVEYKVKRKEVSAANYESADDASTATFLTANSLVPVGGIPESQFLGETTLEGDALAKARKLYEMVEGHVDYDKPEGGEWGRGDAVWVCDSKHGNCTDFHSLFISLSRTSEIPAKFEIGFPIPAEGGEIGGYHCWASFIHDGKWVPVDISEADKQPEKFDYFFGNLSPDRVAFTQGRDLVLIPAQQGEPLNFFVYPYAEVDGQPHMAFEKNFRSEVIE